jgi:glycosyltransferase involved in cell wall biosynthesis
VGGIKEYVDNRDNGFLVNVFDVENLAKRMIELLENEKMLKKFSEKSIEKSKYFSNEIFFKKIKKFYRKVLKY